MVCFEKRWKQTRKGSWLTYFQLSFWCSGMYSVWAWVFTEETISCNKIGRLSFVETAKLWMWIPTQPWRVLDSISIFLSYILLSSKSMKWAKHGSYISDRYYGIYLILAERILKTCFVYLLTVVLRKNVWKRQGNGGWNKSACTISGVIVIFVPSLQYV